uniref:Uncharacterized protein n=1 Tax=Cacopsylla melanoneura TaxID=428564 RepID=A0A8D9B8L1_9HEMI
MFNKFQTVNNYPVNNEAVNTAAPINFQFPAKALQYRKAEQAEFIELFKNKAKVDDFDACRMVHTVGTKQSKHLQERLVEPLEIVGNRRALRVDDEKYPKNLHISDNVHSCNQGTGTTGIVDSIDTIDSEVRNNYTSGNGSEKFWNNFNNEIEPDLIDSETRKTVRHKKFLKRSSTYDLFVGKLLCDARNQTVMNFTNEYVDTKESRETIGTVATREKWQDQCQKQKLVKHIKALSLENEYNVSDLQENFHQIRNEQVSRHSGYMDRSQSNDQESTPNTFQNAKPLKEQFVNRINPREQFMDKTTTKEQVTSSRTHLGIMCNKICSCDSKQTQPIHFCANDFNNYVNFEMIQRGCVEKLVDQNKMKTSVSLHTCNRDTRESGIHICRSQESESRNFETRHQYLDRSHWCYKEKYARTSEKQMLDIRDKRGETIATPNRIIFDTTPEFLESILDRNIEVISQQNKSFENTTSDNINHWNKNCDIQRQICQTHQTRHDLEENEHTTVRNAKTDTIHVTRHDNRIKTPPLNKMDEKKRTKRWNNEGEEYYKPSTLHEHNTQRIQNIQAQSCFRCSNKKRLLRRKSFDLNTYTGREKQHKNWHEFEYSIQGEKSRDLLARRKSCDFGQMRCAENEKNGQIGRKRTKRYWSNESILDKDLCSIFENPMTAHLQLEDTDGLVQDIKDGRFETVNQFEMGRNDNKDLIDLKNKNNSSIKGHTIISMKPALGDGQRPNLLFARRYSMANIIQNQPKTSCLDDGPNTRDSLTNSTDKLNEYTKHELYHSRSFQLDTKDDQLRVNGRYCAKLQGEQDTAIGIPDNVSQHCIGKYVLKKRRSINF